MRTHVFEATPEEQEYLSAHLGSESLIFSPEPLVVPDQIEDGGLVEALCVFANSRISREVIEALPSLKLIVTRTTGFDHIDLGAAAGHGLTVCNVPSYGESTIAEHAFALLLALSHRIIPAGRSIQEGRFEQRAFRGFDLKGKTLGIVGTGRIGQHALRLGKGFGMRLLGYDLFKNEAAAAEIGFEYVSLDELLAQSDVISLHLPLAPGTEHLINAETVGKMKRGTTLLNTGRGEVADTAALADGVESGQIGWLGLDVFEEEEAMREGSVPDAVRRLLGRDNVILTPHSAFNTDGAAQRIMEVTTENVRRFQDGAAQNVVPLPQQ